MGAGHSSLKLTDAGQNMYSMGENAANRSDKSKMRRGVLPACRQRRCRVKAVDKQVATATRCGELLVATSARIGQFE